MKTKKWMSLVLALVMAFSLAIPAFATATPTVDNTNLNDMSKINTATTTVSGTYQAPILALTVPKKINLLLNPYGVSVTTNKDTNIEQTGVQRKIVSADNLIISRSNVPIDIKATATGTIASASGEGNAWTLAKTPLQATSVKKEALVYMVFGDVDTSAIATDTAVTAFMKDTKSTSDTPYAGLNFTDITYATVAADLANVTFADANTKKDGIIIQAGEGKETPITKSLEECTVTGEGTDASPYVYSTVSAVAFKLDGDMISNPKDTSWGKDDKLTVSVAWKFVPGEQASSAGNGGVARTAVNGTLNSSNIEFTITAPNDAATAGANYAATGWTITGTTASIAASSFTGYSSASSGDALSMNVDVTYDKEGGGTGTLAYTVNYTMP
jgi:hypothetical protein